MCVCVRACRPPAICHQLPPQTQKRAHQRQFSLSWGQMLWQYYCTARMDGTVVQHCQSSWPQHVSARGLGRAGEGAVVGGGGELVAGRAIGQSHPNTRRCLQQRPNKNRNLAKKKKNIWSFFIFRLAGRWSPSLNPRGLHIPRPPPPLNTNAHLWAGWRGSGGSVFHQPMPF